METIRGKELEQWKLNAEEDYIKTPISVLKYITILEEQNERLHKPVVSGSLPDAEIFLWLQKQKYQTEQGEQEYKMYFDVDMPKIIKAAIAHFSSGNDR